MGSLIEFRNMELQIHPNIPPFFLFFPFFASLYLLSYFLVFKSWPSKLRPEASSCFISLFHGTPAATLAALSLLPFTTPFSFSSPNTTFQNTVLEYSIAYFTVDLLHYLIFLPSDVLFIGHHLATLFVFLTCRYLVARGGAAILVLLFLAEVTSLMQNVWTLAGMRRFESEFAAKVYAILSPPFYVLYSIVRGFVGPVFVFQMARFYINGGAEGLIPKWIWGSWIIVVGTAIGVSILWVWNLWVELIREKSKVLGEKLE